MTSPPARIRLTAPRVDAFTCPTGKSQAFLWDTDAPTLAVRASPTGRRTYIFESRLHGNTLRLTIGDVRSWPLGKARDEASRLALMVNSGQDPREAKRQQQAEHEAQRQREQAQALTVAQAWEVYLSDRRPHWGERHYQDHEKLARAGGERAKRGTRGRGVTIAGPLHSLMGMRLQDLTSEEIEAWAAREGQTRPTTARLAWRLLRAFLGWCAEQPQYRTIVPARNPAKSRRAREALGKDAAKKDALLKEQLPAWFAAVRAIRNPMISAYLQCLLLTGARPGTSSNDDGELRLLKWEDIDEQWHAITLRDKDESKGGRDGHRIIPLTPYVHQLLTSLPRRGAFVFASSRQDGPISPPARVHSKACTVAGIEGLTFHGLRRSFGSLAEWLDLPSGVVAQIQGHKPSATTDRHYRVRPLDLLRVHHEKLEAWILEQAGVQFDASKEPGKLRIISGSGN